ncbi:hypothetical protein N7465_002457 [Penicillium sp. CMV-2018d]|nr:hypothetical protein N7465_002457 [Penicillium sp. CMV-2018d]
MAKESVEVLEYIGFTLDAARLIYDRYCNRPSPSQNPDDLMAYVSGHLASLNLRQYDNMSPQEALAHVGLNRQIQEGITDPRFSHIFGTQTLVYWAKDTVETNYAALLSQQQLLQSHANQRMAHVVVHPDTDILAEHISLYKGKAHLELGQPGDIIESGGRVNLSTLRIPPGGDFNWNFNAQYWTPEKETAEEYRKFVERRCPTADTCIMHIQVPQSFINNLRWEDLWYSPSWKEYIWTYRKEQMPDPKFDSLWKPGQADVVRGPIFSTISGQIVRIRKENVQSHISEDNVMRLPSGKKACQWVFIQDDTINRLAEQIRGKMHFIIFGAAARSSMTTV